MNGNPYVAGSGSEDHRPEPLSRMQQATIGLIGGTVGLLTLIVLLMILGLIVAILLEAEPYSTAVTYAFVTALVIGGTILSLLGSVLAGAGCFRKVSSALRTLTRPTLARMELRKQVDAIVRDRKSL